MTAPKKLEIRSFDLPELKNGEVLVKITHVGICTWEQKFYRGIPDSYPFIGGHEITGEVAAVGDGVAQPLRKGDRVVVASLTRCGECYYCRRGMDNLCAYTGSEASPGGLWGPGGFGEYIIARGYEVFRIADTASASTATLAEPLACVIRSVDRGNIQFGDTVLVQGGGVMGILHVLLAKARGAAVVLSEPDADRRENGLGFGADAVIDPLQEDFSPLVEKFTGGRGFDAVFFTAGGAPALMQGIDLLRLNGTCVVYGSTRKDDKLSLDPKLFHYNEIYLTGVTKHTKDGFRRAAEIISANELGLERLISAQFPFDEISTAFSRALEVDTYRVVLTM